MFTAGLAGHRLMITSESLQDTSWFALLVGELQPAGQVMVMVQSKTHLLSCVSQLSAGDGVTDTLLLHVPHAPEHAFDIWLEDAMQMSNGVAADADGSTLGAAAPAVGANIRGTATLARPRAVQLFMMDFMLPPRETRIGASSLSARALNAIHSRWFTSTRLLGQASESSQMMLEARS